MIISKKYNYTQVFLKMLCPIEDFYDLLQNTKDYLHVHFNEEHSYEGVVELETALDKDCIVVIQYHPHLGIHLYLHDMEDATTKAEEALIMLAKKMEALL